MSKDPQPPVRDELFDARPTRREFLAYIAGVLALAGCGSNYVADSGATESQPPPPPELATDPFTLGVASGDPLPDSVILWTRLAPDPINGGGMPEVDVPVIWEVAADDGFRNIVASGWLFATPTLAHSVHVDVRGLAPQTGYFYRMRIGDQWTSPTGRTRTLPAANSAPNRFRVALASCQNYRDGYYNAHHYLALEDLDLVFFVGDYIYETGVGDDGSVRHHEAGTPTTLPQFRNRYALYKTDQNLQAAHLRFPWVVTWDDHELANNYAELNLPNRTRDEVLEIRRAAYQAYYEHQPLRIALPDDFGFTQIYRNFDVGDLATVWVLDTRQYRSDQPCDDRPGRFCPAVFDPTRTMLGATQKDWLKTGVQQSTKLWNVIAQQIVFAPLVFKQAAPVLLNPDQWDGYPVERQELIDLFAEKRNVVLLTGDIHAAALAETHATAENFDTPVVSYEVVGTSITSGGDLPLETVRDLLLPQNPQLKYLNVTSRGYAVCEFRRDQVLVEYRIVSTVIEPQAQLSTDAAFRIDRATLQLEGTGI